MSADTEAVADPTRAARIRAAIVLCGGLAALASAYGGIATAGPTTCPLRLALGVPCSTCGMTRAFAAMLHGDFAYALEANLGAPLAFAVVLVHGFAYAAQLATGRSWVSAFWGDRVKRRVGGALLLALLAFSGVTNLVRHREHRGPCFLPAWHARHAHR